MIFKTQDISEFQVGDKAEVRRCVSASDVEVFAEISGDKSAIHVDDAAAKAMGFNGKVAHGLLVGAWISSVIGTRLPGNSGILQSIHLDFRRPIVAPETLSIVVEVTGISPAVRQLKLGISVFRSDGVLAVSGDARSILKAGTSLANI